MLFPGTLNRPSQFNTLRPISRPPSYRSVIVEGPSGVNGTLNSQPNHHSNTLPSSAAGANHIQTSQNHHSNEQISSWSSSSLQYHPPHQPYHQHQTSNSSTGAHSSQMQQNLRVNTMVFNNSNHLSHKDKNQPEQFSSLNSFPSSSTTVASPFCIQNHIPVNLPSGTSSAEQGNLCSISTMNMSSIPVSSMNLSHVDSKNKSDIKNDVNKIKIKQTTTSSHLCSSAGVNIVSISLNGRNPNASSSPNLTCDPVTLTGTSNNIVISTTEPNSHDGGDPESYSMALRRMKGVTGHQQLGYELRQQPLSLSPVSMNPSSQTVSSVNILAHL